MYQLLTNFLSYIPSLYRSALAKTLIHRCFKICNTWDLLHKHIKELEHTLKRNKFPPRLISKEIKKYLDNIYNTDSIENEKEETNYY